MIRHNVFHPFSMLCSGGPAAAAAAAVSGGSPLPNLSRPLPPPRLVPALAMASGWELKGQRGGGGGKQLGSPLFHASLLYRASPPPPPLTFTTPLRVSKPAAQHPHPSAPRNSPTSTFPSSSPLSPSLLRNPKGFETPKKPQSFPFHFLFHPNPLTFLFLFFFEFFSVFTLSTNLQSCLTLRC